MPDTDSENEFIVPGQLVIHREKRHIGAVLYTHKTKTLHLAAVLYVKRSGTAFRRVTKLFQIKELVLAVHAQDTLFPRDNDNDAYLLRAREWARRAARAHRQMMAANAVVFEALTDYAKKEAKKATGGKHA